MAFEVGALVRARGREWVVQPGSDPARDLLILRPLGGTDREIAGLFTSIEHVESADFRPPDPRADLGNHLSCALLRDATRLSFRAGAGPFRALAAIAVEPRPYQLVPLLMALKLDPVRLMIGDDVGIGKTVEACLIARELFDRAEINGLTVLCPPHLAEQWLRALRDQFHFDPALVLSSTAARLERLCRPAQSLFERFPVTVVSTDYIKQERRRSEFLRACPDLVIVDEAHSCTSGSARSTSQRRHDLLRDLVRPSTPSGLQRHLLLVTATPHSGDAGAFRSLLHLLDPSFADMPEDLRGDQNRHHRQNLSRHFVQRRRVDLKKYLDTITPFPDRETAEETYALTRDYRAFLDRVIAFCRETVTEEGLDNRHRRVRTWSALALLRAISSSPAAAEATLRNRSATDASTTPEEADDIGRRVVLDIEDEDSDATDISPGADADGEAGPHRPRLIQMARDVSAFQGKGDAKLQHTLKILDTLLDDGFNPILFCRFVATVEYLHEQITHHLGKRDIAVEAVTGRLPHDERERRVEALAASSRRVLVCTDCLSEGINLQHAFNAVLHYDLSWNPTRHEQREGRVDRFGQRSPSVRALTLYGHNNPIDGAIFKVLLRKHETIRKQLGVNVPVPTDTSSVVAAIMEALILSANTSVPVEQLDLFPTDQVRQIELAWDSAVEREQASRTLFAQNKLLKAINNEVADELRATRRAIGDRSNVEHFTRAALDALDLPTSTDGDALLVHTQSAPPNLRDVFTLNPTRLSFSDYPQPLTETLTRTHPLVAGLAAHILESALDANLDGPGRRCGVIRTLAVSRRTTLLLLRMRFHIVADGRDGAPRPLLAEDLAAIAFEGSTAEPSWLDDDRVEALLTATPDLNIDPHQARDLLNRALNNLRDLDPHLDAIVDRRGAALLDAHRRVRHATGAGGLRTLRLEAHKPPDLLGLFILMPAPHGGRS